MLWLRNKKKTLWYALLTKGVCAYTLYSESSLEMESECYDDEDVAEERQRLQHRRNVEDTLVGKNISKVTFNLHSSVVTL